MKKLCTLFALMAFTLSIHAAITVINYELKDSYGDGWNKASISIVDASSGTTWASLTISKGSESSGSVRVVAGRNYNIVWNSGNYDSECSFTLTDARGIVILSHEKGKAISAGTLLEYKVPIKGDVNGDFDVNIADVMDVVSYVIHGDTSTPVTPPTPSTVDISFELWDSYGDSWNGAAIRIVDTDTGEEVAVLTIDDGDNSSGTVTLTAGHYYDFYWQSGMYDEECYFSIYDANDDILYSYAYEPNEPEPWPDEPLFVGAKKAKKPMVIFDGSGFDDSSIPSGLLFVGDKKGKKVKKTIKNDGGRKRYRKEPDLPVYEGLADGEVFFSYQAPGDASSSTPSPSPTLLRDVNGDKDVNISDVMELVGMVIHGTPIPDIAVSKEALEMLVYTREIYNIIDITDGSGNFEIVCSDPDNLHVYVSGLSFSMYSNTLGSYVVTIKDKESGKTKDIQVIVKEAEPSCPDGNHPHIIDPGLPSGTKWACCNVDATSPETFGGYYAWGETAEKTDYSWASYTHCYGTEETCHDLGSSIIGTKYDVAHYKWGDNWYMPSYDQVNELFHNSTSLDFTSMNGVIGFFFTFSNGNNIFLPCGGWKEGTEVHYKDDSWEGYGCYWLGTPPVNGSYRGDHLEFEYYKDCMGWAYGYFSAGNRSLGYNVRPVINEKAPLAVSATSVEVEIGGNTTVEITTGSGSYTVESSNADIATATVSGSSVIITGVGGGSAAITVTDTQSGNKVSFNVTVPAPPIISPCPDDNHPHMIDLGLPSGTKWACCNVEASKPEDFGGYYAWGETETKTTYSWATYTLCDGTEESCYDVGESICGTDYDVAHVSWGGTWQMPSYNQIDELRDNCDYQWVSLNGVTGMVFTGKNGNAVFLPAGGNDNSGTVGRYWTGTKGTFSIEFACYFRFYSDYPGWYDYGWYRCVGHNVRPVSTASSVPHLQLSTTSLCDQAFEEYTVEILSGSGSYTVESSDEEVALVHIEDNIIYILADDWGEATITVTDTQTGETATIEVSFYMPAPPFSLSESELILWPGWNEIVYCLDGEAGSVESSDETVATASINDDGNVEIIAVSPGTATITVTSDWTGETATVEVTVRDGAAPLRDIPSKPKKTKNTKKSSR